MIYKVFLNLAKKNLNIRQIFICFPNLNSFPCMAFHSSSVKSWFFFDIGEKRKIKKPENYETREVISIRFNE